MSASESAPLWPPLSLSPPDECTSITSDGSIQKLLVHLPPSSSSEPLPPRFARCLIHYVGRILPMPGSSSGDGRSPHGSVTKDKPLPSERDPKMEQDGQPEAKDEEGKEEAKDGGTPALPSEQEGPRDDKDETSIFMDTRAESPTQQPVMMTCGSASQRESGLSLALASMKRGEMSRIYILDPKYGYGDRGSFSFPAVPPSSRLVYDVELVQWEEGEGGEGEEPSARGLLFEERLERAERNRVQGNTLFSQGGFKEALGKYAVSLSYLDEDMLMQLEGDYLDKAHALKIPVHLNMAACQLQTGDHNTAIYNCSEVLSIDPGNVKALFRRAKARRLLGQTEDALKDLEAALLKSPDDAAVKKEMGAIRAVRKEERQAETRLFKGAFGPAPPPRSNDGDVASAKKRMDVKGEVSLAVKDRPAGLMTTSRGLLAIVYSWTIGWLLVLLFSHQKKK